ncbi:DDB1- and CUL4-associated factor 8 [Nymphaea thermarum]|nr:DDB1- and CUL4-associated factor 8 [Nymphaea thermarum]
MRHLSCPRGLLALSLSIENSATPFSNKNLERSIWRWTATWNMRPIAKKAKKDIHEIWQREVGEVYPRVFAHQIAGSEDLVRRLDVHAKLEKHRGCVNTVSFNAAGDILVSGSDDRSVVLWDWDTQHVKLSFHSGHSNNVFQAKIMPFTDDLSSVTCAADGQFDLRTHTATKLVTCKSFSGRSTCMPIVALNAIAIDPRNPNLFAIGGSDVYARLYDVRKYKWEGSTDEIQPTDRFCLTHLIGNDDVGTTGLAFSDHSELLLSYNDELIYLFPKGTGLGSDPQSLSSKDVCEDQKDRRFIRATAMQIL